MKRFRLIASLTLLLSGLSALSHAGTLSSGLSAAVATKNPSDTVTVWISLASTTAQANLAARANVGYASLAEQHRSAIEQLRADNLPSQKSLVETLKSHALALSTRPVKQHWLVNVVEAQVTYGELSALAQRPDVETIYLSPQITSVRPVEAVAQSPQSPNSPRIPPNLTRIHADVAWGMGYTGAGRLVCSFDNGVDGEHVALKNSWRGRNGDSSAAWFDPVYHTTYPHVTPSIVYPDNIHGTHTMGLLVGQVDTLITGVAKDAQWMSAAVIDVKGASILDAFEWAADPDRDPNTMSDVPDVISHSWGYSALPSVYGLGCADVVFSAIRTIEALGIVNIFAAGNDGARMLAPSISNPADGALDSIDCFAVGALTTTLSLPARSPYSSQGPSDCTYGTKPNIMAQGDSVISSIPGNKYLYMTGTSMAAPQVAGLVALLRQKNPNASVRDIKNAILTSANRAGLTGLPNNDYGWGVVDCVAALNALSTSATKPNLRLYDFSHAPIAPGDTVVGSVVIQNLGLDAANVTLSVTGSQPSLTILAGVASFGTIRRNDTVRSANLLRVIVSDTVTLGSVLALPVTISGGGTSTPATITFIVEPIMSKAIATHSTGRIKFSLSNFGVFGMGNTSAFTAGGQGFCFDGGYNDIWEAGIIAANGPVHVSSAVHTLIYQPDMDFVVAPAGTMTYAEPGAVAAQQTHAAFADDHALSPMGLLVQQDSYSYGTPNNDFIILRYILQNKNAAMLSNLRFGLFFDWDIGNGTRNAGAYDAADSLVWQAENAGTASNPVLRSFRGLTVLAGPLATATVRDALITYPPVVCNGSPQCDGYTAQEKYVNLFAGVDNSSPYQDSLNDLFQIIAAGPLTIASHAVDTVAFAIVAGSSISDLASASSRARITYRRITTDVEGPDPNSLPTGFALYQNYPNPFNPSTKISFDLPHESDYTLSIHNVLGQIVDQMNGHAKSGRVEIAWDGSRFATGVYLYCITAGQWSASRKMLLLK